MILNTKLMFVLKKIRLLQLKWRLWYLFYQQILITKIYVVRKNSTLSTDLILTKIFIYN